MINILKLKDADTHGKINSKKLQNAFNQTPVHLLLDPKLMFDINQFKSESQFKKSINTNTEPNSEFTKK